MEEVSNIFPALISMILENVDEQSLVKLKETKKAMSEIFGKARFFVLDTNKENFVKKKSEFADSGFVKTYDEDVKKSILI